MKYTVRFLDLAATAHYLHTDNDGTAHVTAEQLSIQFGEAKVFQGTTEHTYRHGSMVEYAQPRRTS